MNMFYPFHIDSKEGPVMFLFECMLQLYLHKPHSIRIAFRFIISKNNLGLPHHPFRISLKVGGLDFRTVQCGKSIKEDSNQ